MSPIPDMIADCAKLWGIDWRHFTAGQTFLTKEFIYWPGGFGCQELAARVGPGVVLGASDI